MRSGSCAVILFLSVALPSCAGTVKTFVEESCIEGTIYVIGNEPFTHLVIEADSTCAHGELASAVKKKDIFVLSGREDVMSALYKCQGKKVRAFFRKMLVSADGNVILVTQFKIIK